MPRYLLQQWTNETIAAEERSEHSGHGVELWATPSTKSRLLDLDADDVVFVAAVVGGRLLPICRLVVDEVATYDDLVRRGHDPYPLAFQALAKPPLPRMNLREVADEELSLRVRKATGEPLARRNRNPRQLDGQGFRTPQWIDEPSAALLTRFLESVWSREDDTGLNDPMRVSRGRAPQLTVAERATVERRAMDVVEAHYAQLDYELEDVSAVAAWDLTATGPDGDVMHIEVKGTVGRGEAVTVTAGERRHAEQFARPVLAVVTDIALERGHRPTASNGVLSVHLDPWDIREGVWTPTVWRYERDHVPAGHDDDPAHWGKRFWSRRAHPNGDVNLHARLIGSPNERLALLFRDWLRAHPATVPAYSAFKAALAHTVPDLDSYADVKDPVVDLVIAVADPWASATGWTPR